MLHSCPHCDARSVAWDSRCRYFICLNSSCCCSFPVMDIPGWSEEHVVRSLGLNLIDAESVQKWLNGFANQECDFCGPQPVEYPDGLLA